MKALEGLKKKGWGQVIRRVWGAGEEVDKGVVGAPS
jgi:hypothetical protein